MKNDNCKGDVASNAQADLLPFPVNDEAPAERSMAHDTSAQLNSGRHPQSLQTRSYTPYGYCPSTQNSLGFNGERADPTTRHYLLGNGYRGFSPALHRFMSPDSMSPFDNGGMNSYVYCHGDPVNLQDPSGHSAVGKFFGRLHERWAGGPRRGTFRKPAPSSTVQPGVSQLAVGSTAEMFDSSSPVSPQVSPSGNKRIGFHGSTLDHKESLEKGIKPQTGGKKTFGGGFYFTQDPDIASSHAYQREAGGHGKAHVFEVFSKHYHGWRKKVYFKHCSKEKGKVIKVRQWALDKVSVRARGGGPLVGG